MAIATEILKAITNISTPSLPIVENDVYLENLAVDAAVPATEHHAVSEMHALPGAASFDLQKAGLRSLYLGIKKKKTKQNTTSVSATWKQQQKWQTKAFGYTLT